MHHNKQKNETSKTISKNVYTNLHPDLLAIGSLFSTDFFNFGIYLAVTFLNFAELLILR